MRAMWWTRVCFFLLIISYSALLFLFGFQTGSSDFRRPIIKRSISSRRHAAQSDYEHSETSVVQTQNFETRDNLVGPLERKDSNTPISKNGTFTTSDGNKHIPVDQTKEAKISSNKVPNVKDLRRTLDESPKVGKGQLIGANDKHATRVTNEGGGTVSVLPTKPPKRDVSFYRFNTTMSDIIGPYRSTPDKRPEQCKHIKYPDHLPKISVVVIFREEWPSILVRTIYSILNNSPPALLQEIIIVDDGSIDTEPRLQVERNFANISTVKLIVNPKPLGLMMARQSGIEATTSDYFVVMDSHMEVCQGWLSPLVARLVESPNSLLSPNVGTIDSKTLELRIASSVKNFITYDPIEMTEQWTPYSKAFLRLRNGSVDPIPIASVQGECIAMRKDVFMRLGGFDPGMKLWGSEQFELSIKVWLCGGRVEVVPCSIVFHLFRPTPWGITNISSDHLVANSLRTSEVWMDDPHKTVIRESIGRHSLYDIGDLKDRHKIRKKNHCKPFQYFVDTVKTFSNLFTIGRLNAKGSIRNKRLAKCLSTKVGDKKSVSLEINTCHNKSRQYFILTDRDQVRSIKSAVLLTEVDSKRPKTTIVKLFKSNNEDYMRNAVWEYKTDGSLYNIATSLCLALDGNNALVVEKCTGHKNQQWEWDRV